MKSLLSLLLLASCSTYYPQTYTKTITYKVLGTKCRQDYFFNYELGKCVILPEGQPKDEVLNGEAITSYSPNGVISDEVRTYQASPARSVKLLAPNRRVLKRKMINRKDQCRNWLNKGEL